MEKKRDTPSKFNMESENDGFQVRNLLFQGLIFRFQPLNFRGVVGKKTAFDHFQTIS